MKFYRMFLILGVLIFANFSQAKEIPIHCVANYIEKGFYTPYGPNQSSVVKWNEETKRNEVRIEMTDKDKKFFIHLVCLNKTNRIYVSMKILDLTTELYAEIDERVLDQCDQDRFEKFLTMGLGKHPIKIGEHTIDRIDLSCQLN